VEGTGLVEGGKLLLRGLLHCSYLDQEGVERFKRMRWDTEIANMRWPRFDEERDPFDGLFANYGDD
jgi:hypothetical protein